MSQRKGWARCTTGELEYFEYGKIYPCLIKTLREGSQSEEKRLLFPEITPYEFQDNLLFESLDPYLPNLKNILE